MTPCPSCRAPLGGRAGCQAAFDEIGALAWSTPARAAMHNLVVDAYSMQHPEEYGLSAKSYVAHLTALCCGVEHAGDPALYWAIARWLDGKTTIEKPPVIAARGARTVADLRSPAREEEFPDLVRRWAADVWAAYGEQQGLARAWLEAADRHRRHGRAG